jgi:hypothetical protein
MNNNRQQPQILAIQTFYNFRGIGFSAARVLLTRIIGSKVSLNPRFVIRAGDFGVDIYKITSFRRYYDA